MNANQTVMQCRAMLSCPWGNLVLKEGGPACTINRAISTTQMSSPITHLLENKRCTLTCLSKGYQYGYVLPIWICWLLGSWQLLRWRNNMAVKNLIGSCKEPFKYSHIGAKSSGEINKITISLIIHSGISFHITKCTLISIVLYISWKSYNNPAIFWRCGKHTSWNL